MLVDFGFVYIFIVYELYHIFFCHAKIYYFDKTMNQRSQSQLNKS